MEENVIPINDGITINVGVNVKNTMYTKKITFEILLYVAVKMVNIQQVLWKIQQFCVMKLNEMRTWRLSQTTKLSHTTKLSQTMKKQKQILMKKK